MDTDALRKEHNPPGRLLYVRPPVEAMALRKFWTAQIQRWARRGRILTGNGTRRDKLMMAGAVMGLLDCMRADGALRGAHGFWNVEQLAEYMGVSKPTALAVLDELEQLGALRVIPVHDSRGHHQTSERYLCLPTLTKPKVKSTS